MAEVIAVVIGAYPAFSFAWSALERAMGICDSVESRRSQLKCLLSRCEVLMREMANFLMERRTEPLHDSLLRILLTTQAAGDAVVRLGEKGFLWCLLNTGAIDEAISSASISINDAFQRFNIVAHLQLADQQALMEEAREKDESELVKYLHHLARHDHKILNVLNVQEGRQRRIEDLLVGLTQYVSELGEERKSPSVQERFIRKALETLQRHSRHRNGSNLCTPPVWNITSLEISFAKIDCIGCGSFGSLYRGEWDGRDVAVKQMTLQNAKNEKRVEKQRKAFLKEVNVWTTLSHPNILRFYGACMSVEQPFMVSQYCEFGNINQYIKKHECGRKERLSLIADIASGMAYLHRKNVVHGDLKGANVLVGDDRHALLADFGMSRIVDDDPDRSLSTTSNSLQGTIRWMAPELFDSDANLERPNKSCDVYSFGITAWEIFTGKVPYADTPDFQIPNTVQKKKIRPKLPPGLEGTTTVGKLMVECWDARPDSRPSFARIQDDLKKSPAAPNSYGHEFRAVPASKASSPRSPQAFIWPRSTEPRDLHISDDDESLSITSSMADSLDTEIEDLLALADDAAQEKRYADGAKFYEEAWKVSQQLVGREHVESLEIAHHLAAMWATLEHHVEAAEMYEEVVAGRRKALGPYHVDTLDSMHCLASEYVKYNQSDKALDLVADLVEGRKRVFGVEHCLTLRSMHTLASVNAALARYTEAAILFEEVVQLRKRTLGADQFETMDSTNHLATVYAKLRRYSDAAELYQEVLLARATHLGAHHPATLQTKQYLAALFAGRLNRYDEAGQLYEELVERRKISLGPKHADTLRTMHFLAAVYGNHLHRYTDAAVLFEEVVEGRKEVLGLDNVETLKSAHLLAVLYTDLGRYESAVDLFEDVAARRIKILGPHNLATLSSRDRLAHTLYQLRRYSEASAVWAGVVEARKRVLGISHADTLESMLDLGAAYAHLYRHDDVRRLLLEVVTVRESVLGPNHSDTLASKEILARAYGQQGEVRLAEPVPVEVTARFRRSPGLGKDFFGPSPSIS